MRVASLREQSISQLSVKMVTSDTKDLKSVPCQICSKKRHGALNCYSLQPSPEICGECPNHLLIWSPLVILLSADRNLVWYPDSGVTGHITNDELNIQRVASF